MTCVRVVEFIDCEGKDDGLRLKFEPYPAATVEFVMDMPEMFLKRSRTFFVLVQYRVARARSFDEIT